MNDFFTSAEGQAFIAWRAASRLPVFSPGTKPFTISSSQPSPKEDPLPSSIQVSPEPFLSCLRVWIQPFLFHVTVKHDISSQAKFQDTPAVTWCNETTSPVPAACISQAPTHPETSSHSNRTSHLEEEGLQVQGSVSCPACVYTVVWLQQDQRQRWWAILSDQFTAEIIHCTSFKYISNSLEKEFHISTNPVIKLHIKGKLNKHRQLTVLIRQVQYLQSLIIILATRMFAVEHRDMLSVSER